MMNDSPGWTTPGSTDPDPGDASVAGQSPAGQEREDAPTAPPSASTRTPAAGPDSESSAPSSSWSRRQPPGGGGGWFSPANSPLPRQPAPGSRQPSRTGWGAGWAPQRPPAAHRPGVVPLRPLSVGEILDGALSTVRAQWRAALGYCLAVAVCVQAANTVVTGLWFRDLPGLDVLRETPDASTRETVHALGHALGGSAATSLIGFLGLVLATGGLAVLTGRSVLGLRAAPRFVWTQTRRRLPALFGLLIALPALVLATLAVAVGPGLLVTAAGAKASGTALLLVGAVLGGAVALWLWMRYSLAVPALMLEGQGIVEALRRSAKLVRGAWWRVFGVQLLALAIAFVIGAVWEVPTSTVATAIGGENAAEWLSGEAVYADWSFLVVIGLGAVVSSTLSLPFLGAVSSLLYVDQRIRRESLDVELVRSTRAGH